MGVARCGHRVGQLVASVLAVLLMVAPGLAGDSSDEAWAALAKGGHVALIRHGNAPATRPASGSTTARRNGTWMTQGASKPGRSVRHFGSMACAWIGSCRRRCAAAWRRRN